MKTITTGLCVAAMLGSATALADSTIVKVPRENGAVHQEFKNLLNETLSKFRSGVGRVELVGKAGGDVAEGSCEACCCSACISVRAERAQTQMQSPTLL